MRWEQKVDRHGEKAGRYVVFDNGRIVGYRYLYLIAKDYGKSVRSVAKALRCGVELAKGVTVDEEAEPL